MKIEIVTHCYAANLPQFAVFLRAQLSSLVLYKPKKVQVRATVCFTWDDSDTVAVLQEFFAYPVELKLMPLPPEQLFRRSIGRNQAALETEAELVWFADVDHFFGKSCLDTLRWRWKKLPKPKPVMVWPRNLQIQKAHKLGDKFWQSRLTIGGLTNIDPEQFHSKRYYKAIGGVQIVDGRFCREHGYLNGMEKWQRPTDKPFGCFRDDSAFRKQCQHYGETQSITLENLYRLRHTEVTYKP